MPPSRPGFSALRVRSELANQAVRQKVVGRDAHGSLGIYKIKRASTIPRASQGRSCPQGCVDMSAVSCGAIQTTAFSGHSGSVALPPRSQLPKMRHHGHGYAMACLRRFALQVQMRKQHKRTRGSWKKTRAAFTWGARLRQPLPSQHQLNDIILANWDPATFHRADPKNLEHSDSPRERSQATECATCG